MNISNITDSFHLFCISLDQVMIPTAAECRTVGLYLVQVLFSAEGECCFFQYHESSCHLLGSTEGCNYDTFEVYSDAVFPIILCKLSLPSKENKSLSIHNTSDLK